MTNGWGFSLQGKGENRNCGRGKEQMSESNINLLHYLKDLGPTPSGRALHLHLSGLPKANKTRDMIAQAIGMLNEAGRRATSSRVFLLKTLDLVLVCVGADPGALRQTAANIHKSFGRAPVATNVYGTEEFATLIDLGGHDSRLLLYAEALFAAGVNENNGVDERIRGGIDVYLQVMERIHAIDITTILLSQAAYATLTAGRMVPVFREIYVSIKALEDAFCPGANLVKRRTLFTELTEHLDTAVLKVVRDHADFGHRGLSLNLNIATVATKPFAEFDASLDPKARSKVVLEFHRDDIVANFAQFSRLAPDLAARGYSLCIDALDFRLLPHLDLKGLHCRFAKLFWSHEMDQIGDLLRDELAARAKRGEGVEYILARCDSAGAVRLARHAGFAMLQGKLIDHMVKHSIPV